MPCLVSDANDAPEAVTLAAWAIADNSDKVLDLHRATLRDGSAWLLVGYKRPIGPSSAPLEQGRLSLEALPRDTVCTETDPATGELVSAEILRQFTVRDGDQDWLVPLIQTIIPKQISYRLPRESQSPPRSFRLPAGSPNPWSFVPLVRFVNELGAADGGFSELESIEPYMQLYHYVLWAASQGSRMHPTPKLAFSLEDPRDSSGPTLARRNSITPARLTSLLPRVKAIEVYDRASVTVNNETTRYDRVTAGTIYLVRPLGGYKEREKHKLMLSIGNRT